jgi:hypothetical protein
LSAGYGYTRYRVEWEEQHGVWRTYTETADQVSAERIGHQLFEADPARGVRVSSVKVSEWSDTVRTWLPNV